MHRFALIALIALIVLGCRKTPEPEAKKTPAVAVGSAGPTPTDPTMRTLGGRLAYEAAHRPARPPGVEAVFAALGKAGVVVADTKQYIALTAAASYCAGGHTAEGLAVAVCEYVSNDAAVAGRAHVEKTFPNIANRVIEIRGATSMTTTVPDGKDLAALQGTATKVFSTL